MKGPGTLPIVLHMDDRNLLNLFVNGQTVGSLIFEGQIDRRAIEGNAGLPLFS